MIPTLAVVASLLGFIQVALGGLFSFGSSPPPLQKYNVDPSSVTVSGISSGGAMATQFHFIYSSSVKGAGIFAGGPYLCANGSLANGAACMATPYLQSSSSFITEADKYSAKRLIDPVINAKGSKVYIFHGSLDIVVNPISGKHIEEMYKNYGADILSIFYISAGHGQPVDGNGYGGPCGLLNIAQKFINECGYNGAYEMFNWLYGGNLIRPEKGFVADGEIVKFSQTEFFTKDPSLASMSKSGFIYVPKACKDKTLKCKLHVAFHGCSSNEQFVGTDYATKSQYTEVAEKNNIIVVFPQTTVTLTSTAGCWDWFGYTGSATYATKTGDQPLAVYKMMKRVLEG